METKVGIMAGDENFCESAHLEFEQIDGELDAAIVFAAAAQHAYQNGKSVSGAACLSDATVGYAKVLEALPKANLTGRTATGSEGQVDPTTAPVGWASDAGKERSSVTATL
jgi:hypothetical protein